MKKIEFFNEVKMVNPITIKGGSNRTKSIGGRHKGQSDTLLDDGTVIYENGDRGHTCIQVINHKLNEHSRANNI